MNTDNFLIEHSDIELAQSICKMISNPDIRNRAVANAVAANIASRYFESGKYDIDTDSGLHNIGRVLEDIDISDIYINGNYIDVRAFFNEEEMCVPVSNFTGNFLPAAYMFIKINSDLSGAEVIGFVNPENIDISNAVDGYCHITEDMLKSFYDIESSIVQADYAADIADKDIFAYLDNRLEDKYGFYSLLIKSRDGRIKLAKAVKAECLFKFIAINNETSVEDELSDITDNDFEADSINIDIENTANDALLSDDNIGELSLNETDLEQNLEFSGDSLETESSENTIDTSENTLSAESDGQNSEAISPEHLSDANASINTELINPDITGNDEGSFAYSTVTTPSLNDEVDILDELSNIDDVEDDEISNGNAEEKNETNSAEEQIDTLFNGAENIEQDNPSAPGMKVYNTEKKKNLALPAIIIFLFAVAAGLGFYVYSTQLSSAPVDDIIDAGSGASINVPQETSDLKQENAMPVENVTLTESESAQNEGVSASIPAIEQNLDASILVSNLKVEWEVPAAYTSNTSAKRYLTKLGKIIQLNLKTELLLLNKPPITNKIAVEIKYNSESRKFEASDIITSSGEKSVDDLIMQTVNKALAMNLSTNTDSFSKLHGNPVLIIHL